MKRIRLLAIVLSLGFAITSFTSCDEGTKSQLKAIRSSNADSLLFAAGKVQDYDRLLALVDSFESSGDITEISANRWRGVAYYYQGQLRRSEYFYQKVVNENITSEEDQLNYNKSARRLASLHVQKGDYAGALRVALPALQKMEESSRGSETDIAMLLTTIACCQLHIGSTQEAAENFKRAYRTYEKIADADTNGRQIYLGFVETCNFIDEYLSAKQYEEALYWTDQAERILDRYIALPNADQDIISERLGRSALYRAIALRELGRASEAAEAYSTALQTKYMQSTDGRLHANDYLVSARRWDKAADNFKDLDKLLNDQGIKYTLDNIKQYLLPKFRANVGALRKDSAIAVGVQICEALDSAILWAKENDAAELATIYDTHEKEGQIVRQQADLSRQRWIGTLIALALVIAFFTAYTLYRRKSEHRLSVAHSKLQTAYNQLEETTAIKERIESELRIARDIQMSMVPTMAPDHDGLDLYASMTPAKEVGGDLYGYLLMGDLLYFCIGDVSGKGVPASLFMAQATRLFRTLATQHMMPAEIATRMNAALAEGNEQGMFVTMFIGLVDLNSGRLDFCNAGHNPPILFAKGDVHFLEMLPNAPIGLWHELDFEGEHIDNILGIPMLLYTDGLNEAENQQQKQFGDEKVFRILESTPFESAPQVIDNMRNEVEKHRNGAEPNDDLTMMCLYVKDNKEV